VKALAKYAGALGTLSPPEAFLATMATVPRLIDKINLLILIQQFEARARAAGRGPRQARAAGAVRRPPCWAPRAPRVLTEARP